MNYEKPVSSSYSIYPLSDVIGNTMNEPFAAESYHYHHEASYGRIPQNQSCEIEGHAPLTVAGSSYHHISSYSDTGEPCSTQSEDFGLDHSNINSGDNQGGKRCTIWDCTSCGVGKVTEGGRCTTSGCDGCKRPAKRRNTANKKERRRTQSINNAFTELRDCIPNVPSDTKLSKYILCNLFFMSKKYVCEGIGQEKVKK